MLPKNFTMNKELLKKYCNNNCTKEELGSVLTWFEKFAGTFEGKSLLFRIWEELPEEGVNSTNNFDLLLNRIHHEINLVESKKLMTNEDQTSIKHKNVEKFITIFTRVAAILILPVLGFGLYISTKYQSVRHGQENVSHTYSEVFSSDDAITKVTLPDGSNVWLNHGSTLRYPTFFQGVTRTVELTGEGYFEVAHNPKRPFTVKAGEIQILALGTSFNVLAYPDEDRIETSLIEGTIEIQRMDEDKNVINLLVTQPLELVIYDKADKGIITHSIKDERYYSWKDGKLIFKKVPMGEVVKKLSRWFNVDIQIKDPELLELTYTATFIHENLQQVMELLSIVSPIDYSISNREENSDGTFSKRKVVLTYKKKHTINEQS